MDRTTPTVPTFGEEVNTVQENVNSSLELELGMQDLELDMQELEGMDAPYINWSNAVWSVATVSIGSIIVAT
ncbi:hypothetical protein [Kitasatospora camelliae]|uniref:Uncharacterized protein n=1 Tax=Kitasatospora camelliae TaxID=3156397 RepID=A0AAU8JRN8_9ACTN